MLYRGNVGDDAKFKDVAHQVVDADLLGLGDEDGGDAAGFALVFQQVLFEVAGMVVVAENNYGTTQTSGSHEKIQTDLPCRVKSFISPEKKARS